MAMNIHQEARRRDQHLRRVCEARKRLAMGLSDLDGSQQQAGASDGTSKDQVMCTDQGQFYQTRSVHVWTGPERNRRGYDHSRTGPVLGQSWRSLEKEMNFRQNSLSSIVPYSLPPVGYGGFQPVDVAFTKK